MKPATAAVGRRSVERRMGTSRGRGCTRGNFRGEKADAGQPIGGLAVVGSFVASEGGVAEEARTRGFAAPGFPGCAFVEGWCSTVPVRREAVKARSGLPTLDS
jgi:hypothetical protein